MMTDSANDDLSEYGDDRFAKALQQAPELVLPFLRLYGTMWHRGVLDPTLKEVARLRNATVTNCGYCKNVRLDLPREQGLDESQAELVAGDPSDSRLTADQQAVIQYADVFLKDGGHSLGPEMKEAMLSYFTPEQIVELTIALILFMGQSKANITLGTAPDSMATIVIPTPDPDWIPSGL